MRITIKVYMFELVYILNFSLKNNFDSLEQISQEKGHFFSKTEIWTSPMNSLYPN